MPESDHPSVMMSAPGARTVIDGVTYDYFGGTGYLGLQAHQEVIAAGCRAMQTFGVHTATSRTRYVSPSVLNAERQAARFFGTDRAFYLASGYVSTGLLLHAVCDSVDAVFLDAASHYSIAEAAVGCGLPVVTFASRDADDLASKIAATLTTEQSPLVLTDGVFASFGWIAPVDRYLVTLQPYRSPVILIDDAHGFGTVGEAGRGTLDHFGLWDRTNRLADAQENQIPPQPHGDSHVRLLAGGTLSKALGGHGGIIPCDAALLAKITTVAHYFDGASAPAAAVAAASARALQIVIETPELRTRLRTNVARVRAGVRSLGLGSGSGLDSGSGLGLGSDDLPTPIVGFSFGQAADMQGLHLELKAAGILVPYAAAYSGIGPEGAMRLAVFATHTDEMIDRLIATMRRLLR